MKRILPYREENGHDVINRYALIDAEANEATTDSGSGDAGVFVKVSEGNLNLDYDLESNSYLGKSDYPYVFDQLYPSCPLKVENVKTGDHANQVLGITLDETAKFDENGEKLIYNREKADRQDAVFPGKPVRILRRGVVTISSDAFTGELAPGSGFKPSTTADGKVEVCEPDDSNFLGLVLATGERSSNAGITDKFEGGYAQIQIR